jgi:hypothetical protein
MDEDEEIFASESDVFDRLRRPPETMALISRIGTILTGVDSANAVTELFRSLERDMLALRALIRRAEVYQDAPPGRREEFRKLGEEHDARIRRARDARDDWQFALDNDPEFLTEAWSHFEDHLRGLRGWLQDVSLPVVVLAEDSSPKPDMLPATFRDLRIDVEAGKMELRSDTYVENRWPEARRALHYCVQSPNEPKRLAELVAGMDQVSIEEHSLEQQISAMKKAMRAHGGSFATVADHFYFRGRRLNLWTMPKTKQPRAE